ncbi:hypothetical protein GQ43DRAFT_299713 [Delitschia confertaspora ATCC 74209]|uniref:Plus3 domain-containing protein n=1 Tax=Delitschia confertaspora ATCC 74209 TaxID=1513339 RepID=A0A9P4MWW7_9PLEO|nr:hypothetical protein GQ43DRAFT_299713 [Delitschia confertaspora ATCC 74209]
MSDIDDELFALAGGDEEAEEGEASSVAPSSPNSLGSGAMDESESEADEPDQRDTHVLYPLEGKYIDLADKRRIEGMSLLERERILGDRAEEAQAAKFQAELARRAKEREAEEAQKERKKRKATSVEPDDSYHKTSRQKKNEKLEAYKSAREQRGQLRQRQDDHRRRHGSTPRDRHASDVDAEGESEVEWEEQAKQAAARQELPATLREFESVRVGRGFFQKVCFYPGFREAMTGAFVRVGCGQNESRQTLYKMAQIKGFSTGKPYVFEGKNGAKSATNMYVTAQYGSAKKDYNFTFLSNQSFSESDFETYKRSLTDANTRIPNRAFLEKKYNDIRNLENRSWRQEEISEKIKLQNEFAHLVAPASGRKVDPMAQRLAEVNAQNRKANSQQIRQALIDERHAELRARRAREKELRKKQAEEQAKAEADTAKLLQVPESGVDDLFGASDVSGTGTPTVRSATPTVKKEKKTGIATFSKRKMDDDVISSIDLGIDIDF